MNSSNSASKLKSSSKVRASVEGVEKIREARIDKGWNYHADWKNDTPLRRATKLLEPERVKFWEERWTKGETIYAVADSTWIRFQAGKEKIYLKTFQVFCQILDLEWEEIAELDTSGKLIIGDPPDRKEFYGRVQYLHKMNDWIIEKTSRLTVVWGQPGIGKTALVREFLEKVKTKFPNKFKELIWITPETLLSDLFPEQSDNSKPIAYLFQLLKKQKALIVLDRWTEVLEINHRALDYAGESYDSAKLLKKLAEQKHTNSFILISDERPVLSSSSADCSINLKGLGKDCSSQGYIEDRKILKELIGTEAELDEFLRQYDNPSILQSVIDLIKEVHLGDLSEALSSTHSTIFLPEKFYPNIGETLNRVWSTLSQSEETIIYCLAIHRGACSFDQLKTLIDNFGIRSGLTELLYPLMSNRALIERDEDSKDYQLSAVWQKFATTKFVERNAEEIILAIKEGKLRYREFFLGYPFSTTDTCDQETEAIQMRRIVMPILDKLIAEFGEQEIRQGLEQLLNSLQTKGNAGKHGIQNIRVLLSKLNSESGY